MNTLPAVSEVGNTVTAWSPGRTLPRETGVAPMDEGLRHESLGCRSASQGRTLSLSAVHQERLSELVRRLELIDAEYFERRDDTESRDDILYPDDIPSA